MKKLMVAAGLAIGVLVPSVFAQAPPPKPGVEVKRLGYFEGQWKVETESKQSFPAWPAGKYTGTQACQWFTGGFHLVCRSDVTTPSGTEKGESIYGYDPLAKTYTLYNFGSSGNASFVRGTVSGPVWTWTWNSEGTVDGKLLKVRNTVTEQSPTSATIKNEVSFDGGAWTVLYEGSLTKAK